MGRHVGKRRSRNRDGELTRMRVRWSGRNDSTKVCECTKRRLRWWKDSERRGERVSGRWSEYEMEVNRVGMILSVGLDNKEKQCEWKEGFVKKALMYRET